MSPYRAEAVLNRYADYEKVCDVYDEDSFAAAINALIPGFEYPDWSHKTVGEVKQAIARLHRAANPPAKEPYATN